MQCTASIDWLRFSVPNGQTAFDFATAYAHRADNDPTKKPIPRYSSVQAYECLRIDYHVVKPELRTVVTMTGEHLRKFAEYGHDIRAACEELLSLDDINFTRVDAALDFRDSGGSIEQFFRAFLDGAMATHTTSGHLIRSGTGEHIGYTAYIGSRESARMLRLYDKGVQSGVGGDWLRAELEIKKPMTETFVRAVVNAGVVDATCAAMRGFMPRSGFEWFDRTVLNDGVIVDMKVGRKETLGNTWLYETALGAVCKAMLAGDELILRKIRRALATWDGSTPDETNECFK